MTSKIVVNNIESDAGVSTVFFNSDIGATDGTLNVDGNLTVDGVITYEDVTNIDSVGVITARSGINVTGGNVAIGTVTASEKLDVWGTIRASQGPSEYMHLYPVAGAGYFDVSNSTTYPAIIFRQKGSGGIQERLRITSTGKVEIKGGDQSFYNASTVDGAGNNIFFATDGGSTETTKAAVVGQNDGANTRAGRLLLNTSDSSGNVTERLRIDSDGRVKSRVSNLAVNTDNATFQILTTESQAADFGGTLGLGGVYHATNQLSFTNIAGKKENGTTGNSLGYLAIATRGGSGMAERLRITSAGQLLHTRSDNTTRYDLEFRQTGGVSDGNYSGIHWSQGATGSTNLGAIEIAYANTGRPDIVFKTRQSGGNAISEAMSITSSGLVRVGHPTANHSSNVTQDLEIKGRYVNAAGDFSRLIFGNSDDSGGSTASIRAERTGNNFGTELKFFTNPQSSSGDGLERLRINRNGIVTKSAHPSFIAGRTGGNETFTLGTFPFNVARVNVGNHYNTSTYKFVAPVAGVYYFYAQVYYNDGAGQHRIHFRKTPSGGSAINLNTSSHQAPSSDSQNSMSIVESLAVGDAVELYSDQNNSVQCYYNINNTAFGAHTYFMGYLIG